MCKSSGETLVITTSWFVIFSFLPNIWEHNRLKVPTIEFSSENNPPMLRTWLLGKETLVGTRGPCLWRTAGLWKAWQLSDRPQSLRDNNLFKQTDWPCAECFHYPGIQMAIRLISFDLKKKTLDAYSDWFCQWIDKFSFTSTWSIDVSIILRFPKVTVDAIETSCRVLTIRSWWVLHIPPDESKWIRCVSQSEQPSF